MSTIAPAPEPAVAAAPAPPTDPDVTTFRGKTLEELLPQIREQLGPDAVVVRQRDGLVGGLGGFFQQRFVEVDAKAGGPRIDVYDEEPATPAPIAAPAEPGTFATLLAEAADETLASDGRMSTLERQSPPAPAPLDAEAAPALTEELTRGGMSASFAKRLVEDAEAHELPFATDLRAAVRRAVARRIPTSLPYRAGGLAVAFAGPGSTACADALASVYRRAGRDAHALATLEKARIRLERGNPDALLALDLPPVASARSEVDALAARLDALRLDEIVAVVPADLDLPAARALLDRMRPLAPTALALDAVGPDLGAAIELACETRLPLAYVHDAVGGIAPVDPAPLAERLLP